MTANARPKSYYTLRQVDRRWLLDLKREAYDLDSLDAVLNSIKDQCRNMIHKAQKQASKQNRQVTAHYVEHIKGLVSKATRRHAVISRETASVLDTKSKLFGGLSDLELEDKLKQIMKIPQDSFKGFNKLSPELREARLLELMNEYGKGSKNAGFAAAELNQQGAYRNTYMTNEKREKDGTKRRPQFIHEMISRLIYGCIHPDKYKEIFFQRTDNVVQKWGKKWRQMRSEGRFAMVRVLIVLLPYLDYKRSMRIGYRDKKSGEYLGISRSEIAKRAGISFESVKNALNSLEEQCLIHKGKQRRVIVEKGGEPSYCGLAVVRCVSVNLMVRLGLGDRWIDRERKIKADDTTAITDKEKDINDQLDYARQHPEQFTNKQIAALEIKAALAA